MKTKQQKQAEAIERDAAWRDLSPKQQLTALDQRLGKGIGAKKQRLRIWKRIVSNSQDPCKEATNYGVDSLPPPLRLAIAYGIGPEKLKEILENPNVDSDS